MTSLVLELSGCETPEKGAEAGDSNPAGDHDGDSNSQFTCRSDG